MVKRIVSAPSAEASSVIGTWKVLSVPSHSMGYHTLPIESIEMR